MLNLDANKGRLANTMISEQEILNASILIVDDQQANVFLLEQVLREADYRCIASTMDPYVVCELHRKNHYDLILLDLQMPGMDGFQVMEGLKEIETDGYLPVLVITAQPGHKLRALAAGAKDFIAKPFDLVEVKMRIHIMLEVRLLYKKLEHYNKVLENYNQMLGQTVLKRTAELTESEESFHRLTALSSEWCWEQDENGHFTKIFGSVPDMLGICVGNALNSTREDHGACWNEAERGTLEANLTARQPFLDFVYSRINPDGTQQCLMLSGEPMFDSSGRFVGYRGTGKDVTETLYPNKQSSA
jgi:CheY-like chemotaxis protein